MVSYRVPSEKRTRIQRLVLIAAACLMSGGLVEDRGDVRAKPHIDDAERPRGLVVALRRAALTTELTMPVAHIAFREGQAFAADDVLVSFDCRRGQAELRAAKAQQAEARLTHDNNAYLAKRNAIGTHDVKISQARLEKAEADVDAMEARLAQCTIKAPFAGVVAKRSINVHETPVPGTPFLEIVSNESLEIALIVPSRWLVWLRPGTKLAFDIDELATSVDAETARVGAVVDPVSQTVEIFARIDHPVEGLRAGMSGSARFANFGG